MARLWVFDIPASQLSPLSRSDWGRLEHVIVVLKVKGRLR